MEATSSAAAAVKRYVVRMGSAPPLSRSVPGPFGAANTSRPDFGLTVWRSGGTDAPGRSRDGYAAIGMSIDAAGVSSASGSREIAIWRSGYGSALGPRRYQTSMSRSGSVNVDKNDVDIRPSPQGFVFRGRSGVSSTSAVPR